jgi:hypothetical protein
VIESTRSGVRSTKRTHYRIQDPALRFWFRVYSRHRSRWHDYSIRQKQKLLQDHASTVFEDFCRLQFTDATRYWEGDLEFDLVRSERRDDEQQTLVVSEVISCKSVSNSRNDLAPLSVSVMAMRIVEELNRGLIKVSSPDSGRRAKTSPLLFTRTSLVAGNFREVPRRITRERQPYRGSRYRGDSTAPLPRDTGRHILSGQPEATTLGSAHSEAASAQKSVRACATIKGHCRPVRAYPYANRSANGAMPTTPTAP